VSQYTTSYGISDHSPDLSAVCSECGCTFGFRLSTLRPHHASAAVAGAALASGSTSGGFEDGDPGLPVTVRHGSSLATDCQLISDEGRRQLRSALSRTCVVRRTYSNYETSVLQVQVRSCGTAFQLNWADITLWLTVKVAPHKFSYLLTYLPIMKIIQVVATKCQILTLKCTKFDLACAPPQTPVRELTALPWPLAGADGDCLPLRLLEPQSSQCREAAKYVLRPIYIVPQNALHINAFVQRRSSSRWDPLFLQRCAAVRPLAGLQGHN